jgi:hypothetical protein
MQIDDAPRAGAGGKGGRTFVVLGPREKRRDAQRPLRR